MSAANRRKIESCYKILRALGTYFNSFTTDDYSIAGPMRPRSAQNIECRPRRLDNLPLQPIPFACSIGVCRRFFSEVSVKRVWSFQTLPVSGEAEGLPMGLSEMQDRILDFQDSLDAESFSLFLPDESSIKRMDGFHVSQKVGLAQGCGRLAA